MKIISKQIALTCVWIGCVYAGLMGFRALYMLLFHPQIGHYTLNALQVVMVLLISFFLGIGFTYVLSDKTKNVFDLQNVAWVIVQSAILIGWSEVCRWWHKMVVGTPYHANDSVHIQTAQAIQADTFLLIGFGIIIVCIAPVLEECLFRLLFDKLVMQTRFRFVGSLISATVFSAIHTSHHSITTFFYWGIGVLLYGAYSRRGSIWESILVHALFNVYILWQFKDVLL